MVGFENIESHVIDMNQFELKYRFIEEIYNILPEEHLNQLKPLDKEAAEFLNKFISGSELHNDFPFKKGFFKTEDSIVFTEEEGAEQEIKKWLYQRGFPFEKNVFLSWDNETAMIVPWKLLVKYFDDFFYPGPDDLTVFDSSLNWAIMFFHEARIYFGTNEKYELNKIPSKSSTKKNNTTI